MGEPEMAEDGQEIDQPKTIKCRLRRCNHHRRASQNVCFGIPEGTRMREGVPELILTHGPRNLLLSPEMARKHLAKFDNVEEVRKQLGMPHEVFAQPPIGRNRPLAAPKRPPVFTPEDIKMLGEVIAAGVVAGLTAAKTGPVPVAPPGPHPTGPGVPKRT